MLKLINNYVPTGTIDGANKEFKTDKIISSIESIVVDGVNIDSAYSWNGTDITISVDVAPVNTIVITYFYRDVNPIRGNGMVTLGTLRDQFYKKIGRLNENGSIPTNLNRIYPEAYVKTELRKSLKRITNKSPEANRLQQYTTMLTTGSTIIDTTSDNVITLEETLTNDIAGMFYVGAGVAYDYYSLVDGKYQVKGADISEIGDKLLIGSKIPYGVQKISEIRIEGVIIDWMDEREFHMGATANYTIIKDWQGNSYIFLPYSEKSKVVTINFIPDMNWFSEDEDVINIEEEYTDVIVYDTAYRLMRDKEDERWIGFKDELGTGKVTGLLYEYQAFIKSQIKRTRAKIGFAKTI